MFLNLCCCAAAAFAFGWVVKNHSRWTLLDLTELWPKFFPLNSSPLEFPTFLEIGVCCRCYYPMKGRQVTVSLSIPRNTEK